MGLPPRSCATDAYHCIMVEVRAGPAEYKCVARSRAPWRAPLGSTTRIPEANEMRLDIKDPIQACPGAGRGWAFTRIHVEYNDLRSSPPAHFINPLTRQID